MRLPPTFLILDDSEDNRFLTAHALRKGFPGAHIVEAENTADAGRLAREHHPSAILSDHHLGEADGPSFMRALRAEGIACPVIMITASSDPKVHRRAREAGAQRVFSGNDLEFVAYLKEFLARHGHA